MRTRKSSQVEAASIGKLLIVNRHDDESLRLPRCIPCTSRLPTTATDKYAEKVESSIAVVYTSQRDPDRMDGISNAPMFAASHLGTALRASCDRLVGSELARNGSTKRE